MARHSILLSLISFTLIVTAIALTTNTTLLPQILNTNASSNCAYPKIIAKASGFAKNSPVQTWLVLGNGRSVDTDDSNRRSDGDGNVVFSVSGDASWPTGPVIMVIHGKFNKDTKEHFKKHINEKQGYIEYSIKKDYIQPDCAKAGNSNSNRSSNSNHSSNNNSNSAAQPDYYSIHMTDKTRCDDGSKPTMLYRQTAEGCNQWSSCYKDSIDTYPHGRCPSNDCKSPQPNRLYCHQISEKGGCLNSIECSYSNTNCATHGLKDGLCDGTSQQQILELINGATNNSSDKFLVGNKCSNGNTPILINNKSPNNPECLQWMTCRKSDDIPSIWSLGECPKNSCPADRPKRINCGLSLTGNTDSCQNYSLCVNSNQDCTNITIAGIKATDLCGNLNLTNPKTGAGSGDTCEKGGGHCAEKGACKGNGGQPSGTQNCPGGQICCH